MSNQDISKKKKIIISIVAVVVAVLVVLGTIFTIKELKYEKTDYGVVNSFSADSENTFSFKYTCPYTLIKPDYKVDENGSFKLTSADEEYDFEVQSVVYEKYKTEKLKSGGIVISAKVDNGFKFKNDTLYTLTIGEGSIYNGSKEKSVPEIKHSFSVEIDDSGNIYSSSEEIKNYDVKSVLSSEVRIEKENNNYYAVAELISTEFTKLNESGLKNSQTGFTIGYKSVADGYKVYTLNENVTADFDNGSITVKIPLREDMISNGTDYVIRLEEGLLMNDKGDVASGVVEGTCTLMWLVGRNSFVFKDYQSWNLRNGNLYGWSWVWCFTRIA